MKVYRFLTNRGFPLTLLFFACAFFVPDIFFRFLDLSVNLFEYGLTIIGFVLTILIFFQGIAKDTIFMNAVYSLGKNKELTRLCALSIFFALLCCIFSLVNLPFCSQIAMYSLIVSISQLCGVTISMLQIIKYNNKSKKK